MNKIKLIIYGSVMSFMLSGCNQILEPVLFSGTLNSNTQISQEEFSINIEPLTFLSASKANKNPYTRKLMQTGSGSSANVFNEAVFLNTKLPNSLQTPEYIIGISDELSFTQLSEFLNGAPQWPEQLPPAKYLLGMGDKLTFIRQNEVTTQLQDKTGAFTTTQSPDTLITTTGIVGTNGNILLLGIGNINVGNRTLDEVRNDVRNILIRNGLAPNFQLEITHFGSKKAFLTTSRGGNSIISINNLPITLQEILLSSGVSQSFENYALITISRDTRNYQFTAKQLFESSSPDIYIQDKDQINIKYVEGLKEAYTSIVGSQGNILLPNIGKIKAEGKSLKELQLKITEILSGDGMKPNFQLELTGFKSKKAYLISKDSSLVIPLTDKKVSVRELILSNNILDPVAKGLEVFTLRRGDEEFKFITKQILNPETKEIWVHDGDQIEVRTLEYKPGQVFAIGGTNSANIIDIDPSKRETLADVLFVKGGALNDMSAKRSEVYLLRGRRPSTAFHLDTQNVSRILVAAKTELRPNDVIFVAERPIISFARTLAEITPLRILLRDIRNDELP